MKDKLQNNIKSHFQKCGIITLEKNKSQKRLPEEKYK